MRPGVVAGFGYAGIVPWQLAQRRRVLSPTFRMVMGLAPRAAQDDPTENF
jgi:hypothetical protein